MLLHLAYGTYLLLLFFSTIILSISHRRIQTYISFDPKAVNLLLPLIVNVIFIIFSSCWQTLYFIQFLLF
jgi:hypothetical protein